MTQPVLPFWFLQRQGKCEPAGEATYRLTAPNQGEAFITIRQGEQGRYSAHLRLAADGPDVDGTGANHESPADAWGAAFELYRTHVVV